jgi:hypothetical protein
MRPVANAALGLIGVLGACQGTPIRTCADDLSGIWAADDGRRFHLVDRRETVEVYPLFDPVPPEAKQARPWRTPPKTELRRQGGRLAGKSSFRVQDVHACTVTTPARIEGCAGGRAALVIDLDAPVDARACAAATRERPPMTIHRL